MQLFANNANSRLFTGISNVSLSLQVAAGDGAKFPNPTGGDFFLATLSKVSGGIESSIEIVKVTARATDVFTIVRAQEGTTALVYAESDWIQLRMTAASATSAEAHINSVANPHSVTKAQVGLGSVDNTADVDKPVSTAQATAIGLKIATAAKDTTGGVPGLTLFKLNMRNAANTITSWFTNSASVARTWTLPDKDGTVAMTSDITGTNSGTNTGDNAVNTLYSGLVTNATHTGDATGSTALTVVRINGTALSGLATGLLKNTTGTGVPSIAAATDITGQLITGYISGAGTVAATDTILQAVNKLNGNDALKQTLAAKDATGGYAGLTLFKINFKNVANTFTSFFTNSNTAARTYTFQDRDGTIADNTDLATKQATLVSATNIKTVNSTTLLGSGDLAVQATLVSGTNIKTVNGSSILGSGNLTVGDLAIVTVSGTTQTAVAGNNYVLNNVAATAVTMPTTLVAGDSVTISPNNGLLTNTVDFGAKTVRFGANTMTGVVTLDLGAPMELVAVNTSTWMWL